MQIAMPPPPRISKKVCFIAGAGHSGSTLLGFILGSHSDSFYCGEAAKSRYLQDDSKKLIKRVCKLCGEACRVWGDFRVCEDRDLYEQVAVKVNKSLIIDSSKNVDWINQQVQAIESTIAQPYLIFLRRDGRAVINSRIRKYPHKNAQDLILDWLEQIQLTTALFDAFPFKKLKVSYEELATNTEAIVRNLCEFLETDYQAGMLNYGEHEHHVLGGNNGTQFLVAQAQAETLKQPFVQVPERSKSYYQAIGSGIRLDLRWKQELDPAIAGLFEEIAGRVNQELKWEA